MRITLEIERNRLELLESSTLVGICYLDGNNSVVQEFDDDPTLREAIIEYQTKRVQELYRSELNAHQVHYQIG